MSVYGCHGCLWVSECLWVSGCLWVYMGVYGCLWASMGIYGCLWVCMGVYGFLWFYAYLWVSWVSMGVYGFLGVYGYSWTFMGFYGCLLVSGCLWVPIGAYGFLGLRVLMGIIGVYAYYIWELKILPIFSFKNPRRFENLRKRLKSHMCYKKCTTWERGFIDSCIFSTRQ